MCGIAGFHIKDRHIGNPNIPLENLVDGLLLNIVKRGHHATGLCAVQKDGTMTVWKKDVEAKDFIEMREWLPEDTKTILLHTRYYTKGKPSENKNNHPVIYKNCVAVHNGQIDNDDELFRQYKMHRPAEVDSIAIPMMVHKCGWEGAKEAFEELKGSMATAIVDKEHPGELWIARTYGSPFHYFMDNRFFMFASLRDYIIDAWTKNYGTAPDKKKIHELDAYSTIKIVNDELVVDKFRRAANQVVVPASTVRGRPSEHQAQTVRRQINTAHDKQYYWWEYDDEGAYDPGGATARLKDNPQRSTSASACGVPANVEVITCIECGNSHTKMNIKYMKDANLIDKMVYEWEIPVCVRCITDMNLTDYCDGFTYAHQGARSFSYKMHKQEDFTDEELGRLCLGEPWDPAGEDEDECDRCNYFPTNAVGRAGKFLCRSCLLDEKTQEAKKQIERQAARTEKLSVVKPGDELPDDLKVAMGVCTICNHRNIEFISKEGIPVCRKCWELDRIPEGANENDPLYGWCQGCDTRFTKKHLQHTWWGTLCELCLRGQESPQLQLDAGTSKDSREEDLRTAIYARACKEAAEDTGYTHQFVRWIVAECSMKELLDMDMVDVYEVVKDSYDDACWVVEYLINEGRQDDLGQIPLPAEIWTEALSHKED